MKSLNNMFKWEKGLSIELRDGWIKGLESWVITQYLKRNSYMVYVLEEELWFL